jgi:hypothetical protein
MNKDIYHVFLERTGRGSMITTSNRDTAKWLAMFDDVLLAQSAVDRFKNAAYDFVIEGESYRPRLKPKLDDADPPPNTAAQAAPAPPISTPSLGPTTMPSRSRRDERAPTRGGYMTLQKRSRACLPRPEIPRSTSRPRKGTLLTGRFDLPPLAE